MGSKKKKIPGAEQFDRFFADVYGERWESLKNALLEPGKHMDLQIAEDKSIYYLDRASWIAAKSLPLQPGMAVLDLCAAPGGKSLILASKLEGTGSLTCNELSPGRRKRLRTVLHDHLPQDWQEQIHVTGFDGSKWCLYEKEVFDAVLLDAPCSSERHLLHSPEHLKQWSPARTKNLAVRQYSLAVSALDTLKPGGWMLYSTCSLSPLENDGIIAKMLKKRKGLFEVVPTVSEGEDSEYGKMILPDREGWGPIYFCLIRKTENQSEDSESGDSANL